MREDKFKDIKVGDIVEAIDKERGVVIGVCEQDDSKIAGGITLKYDIFKVKFCSGRYGQFTMDGYWQYTDTPYIKRIISATELKEQGNE